jgi:hypothetical protein
VVILRQTNYFGTYVKGDRMSLKEKWDGLRDLVTQTLQNREVGQVQQMFTQKPLTNRLYVFVVIIRDQHITTAQKAQYTDELNKHHELGLKDAEIQKMLPVCVSIQRFKGQHNVPDIVADAVPFNIGPFTTLVLVMERQEN